MTVMDDAVEFLPHLFRVFQAAVDLISKDLLVLLGPGFKRGLPGFVGPVGSAHEHLLDTGKENAESGKQPDNRKGLAALWSFRDFRSQMAAV